MATSRIKVWSNGELVKESDLNAEFDNLITAILAINPQAASSITPDLLANGANPEVFFGELFADGAVVGDSDFTVLSTTGLTVTLSSGTAYVLQTSTDPDKLVRVNIASSTTHTVLDNTTNYLDLGSDGVIDVTQSATPATDHTRLTEVVASGAAISGTTDKADRSFLDDTIAAFKPRDTEWSVASASTVTITSGTRFRDTTNTRDFEFDSNQTVDITASGANGLDQGAEGSSKWYAVVGIGDSSGVLDVKGMFVEAANYTGTIVLPTGYDMYKRIGWVRNDGSSNFLEGRQFHRRFYYEDAQLAGNFTDVSFTTKSFAAVAPPTCREVFINSRYAGGGVNNMEWRETSSSASSGHRYFDANGGAGGTTYVLLDTSQQADFLIGGGTNNCYVSHFIDDLEEES